MSEDPANIYEAKTELPSEVERLSSFDLPYQISLGAIGSIQPDTRFLDVGAGPNTALLKYIQAQGGQYTAIDKNPVFLEKQKLGGAVVVEGDVRKLPFENEAFDVGHARFVIAHLAADKQKAIKEILRVIRPGGRAIFIDYDWTTARGSDSFEKVKEFMINGGFFFDADFGAELETMVRGSGVNGLAHVENFPATQMFDYSSVLKMRDVGTADLRTQGMDKSIAEWNSILDELKAESDASKPPGFYFPGSKIVTLTKE